MNDHAVIVLDTVRPRLGASDHMDRMPLPDEATREGGDVGANASPAQWRVVTMDKTNLHSKAFARISRTTLNPKQARESPILGRE